MNGKAEGGIQHFTKAEHNSFKRSKSQFSQALEERLTSGEKGRKKQPPGASFYPSPR